MGLRVLVVMLRLLEGLTRIKRVLVYRTVISKVVRHHVIADGRNLGGAVGTPFWRLGKRQFLGMRNFCMAWDTHPSLIDAGLAHMTLYVSKLFRPAACHGCYSRRRCSCHKVLVQQMLLFPDRDGRSCCCTRGLNIAGTWR